MTKFQENLKKYREKAGMSKKELAALVGIDSSVYFVIENGNYEPPIMMVVKIADVLKVSVDALIGRMDDGERHCSKQEAIGRIIELCKQQDECFMCPFHEYEPDECVFWSVGLPVPCDWKE